MQSRATCKCGRLLDWSSLLSSSKPYYASVSCETCGMTWAVVDGKCEDAGLRQFGQNSLKFSPSIKAKGKGKERTSVSERYNYARLQLVRPKARFVFNPLQGSELEAPKYSGMLFLFGREWLVSEERRLACALCAESFSLFNRKNHCMACGEIVCKNCSPQTVQLASYGTEQRVCLDCAPKQPSASITFSPPASPRPTPVSPHSPLSPDLNSSAANVWRERFFAIQNYVLYLRSRPVLVSFKQWFFIYYKKVAFRAG
eukprot:Phypoly_transcript_15249.p1 GENE.Phypoly_transcript_15249~~Phypoly_transcript_15249.p1  ORF type:complete len:257 (+),score=20.03 Phypoly_transcript_15249:98-868(+)